MDSFVTANEDLSASGANIFPKKKRFVLLISLKILQVYTEVGP